MNTNQTIDAQCAEYSGHAFYCAKELLLGEMSDNTLYGMRIRIPALADRIIALRTLEAAQQAQAVRS